MDTDTIEHRQQAAWAAGGDAAGLAGFEVLGIDNPFWRFYRLRE
jgi:hypothetical protein